MEIKFATFDLGDQVVKLYNAIEWHNFIAETREYCEAEDADLTLEELFDEYYGDEFWFEEAPNKPIYTAGFDLCSEEFVWCSSDVEVEAAMAWAEDGGNEEELFWCE